MFLRRKWAGSSSLNVPMGDSKDSSNPFLDKSLSDLIRELIALEKVPFKKRDFEKVRKLEAEITLKRKILEQAIRTLRPLYPELSISELEQKSALLYAEQRSKDEEQDRKWKEEAALTADKKKKEAAVSAAKEKAEAEEQHRNMEKVKAAAFEYATMLVRSGQVSKCHCDKGTIYEEVCRSCGGLGYMALPSPYRRNNRCMACNGLKKARTICPTCKGESFVANLSVPAKLDASTILEVKRLLDNPVGATLSDFYGPGWNPPRRGK